MPLSKKEIIHQVKNGVELSKIKKNLKYVKTGSTLKFEEHKETK